MRLYALDIIRFVAALSVVLYHYTARQESYTFPLISEFTKYGYLGVPLFFIISGYVISLSASNRSALEFSISRVVRIYPTYWICVSLTSLSILLFAWNGKSVDIYHYITNMTMLNDYIGYKNIDAVYWTLQAELKFYFCIFLLLFFNVYHRYKVWLAIWMAITLSYSAFMQPFFMGWIINPTYSSFFIAGVTFYLIHKNGIDIFYLSILLLSLALSSISIANGIEIYIKNPSLADQVIAVSIIVSFYILFFYMATNRFNVKKRNIYMILGGLTYPLYLTHNIIGKTIIDYYRPNNPEWLVVIVTIVIMLMLSYIIHIHFEKKMSLPIKKVLMNTAKKHASFFGIQHKH